MDRARLSPLPNVPSLRPSPGSAVLRLASSRALLVLAATAPLAASAADGEPSAPAPPPPMVAPIGAPEVVDPLLAPPSPLPSERLLSSFEAARELLERRSPDLALARAEVEKARGVARQALAGVLPTIAGTASLTARPLQPALIPGVSPPGYGYLTQVVATERVVAPATWELIGANEDDVTRAQLSADDARRRVYAGLAEAILSLVVAERAAQLGRDGLRASLQTQALWQRRHGFGVATELDLARLGQDVAAARLAVIERHEAVQRAREAVGLALGFDEGWGVTARVDADGLEASLRRACTPVTSPDERPDVAAAAASVGVSRRLVTKTEREFLPTVDLVTTLGMQPASFTSTDPAANLQIGGVVSWSIWDGGSRYGALRVARSNVAAGAARHEKLRREAGLQSARLRRAVEVASRALVAALESRDQARETDRLVRAALAAGSGSTLDLVQAQQLVRRADTEVALREYEVVRAKVERLLVTSRCAP